MNKGLLLHILFTILILSTSLYAQIPGPKKITVSPIFHVNYIAPTADKPQSKSWNFKGKNWILLPGESGPELWHTDERGWQPSLEINTSWKGLPGKGDVFSIGNKLMILLVGDCRLIILSMRFSHVKNQYIEKFRTDLPIPENCHEIETGTISQDVKGDWWVCSDLNESIMVWNSRNGKYWTAPYEIASGIDTDDISVITRTPNYVSIIWSNQKEETIFERIHWNKDKSTHWSTPTIVEQGNKNADDHLNTAVLPDHTLMVISKNSVDKNGEPQFVLRIKSPEGKWTNQDVIDLTKTHSPTRPVIVNSTSGKIFEIHTVHQRGTDMSFISVNEVVKDGIGWKLIEKCIIKSEKPAQLNNVTASKEPFEKDQPWNIYFSDDEGYVYTFDIKDIIH